MSGRSSCGTRTCLVVIVTVIDTPFQETHQLILTARKITQPTSGVLGEWLISGNGCVCTCVHVLMCIRYTHYYLTVCYSVSVWVNFLWRLSCSFRGHGGCGVGERWWEWRGDCKASWKMSWRWRKNERKQTVFCLHTHTIGLWVHNYYPINRYLH